MTEIKNRWNGKTLYTAKNAQDIRAAVIEATEKKANLYGADLCGAYLYEANLCGAYLRGANLREANLCGADLREANLREANLCGADLREANLCGADLREANLCGADLREANLCGADLREAKNWVKPDPKLPKKVAKKILKNPEKTLNMGDWHTCETTHCLAGWAVHLSGPAGYALEALVGPSTAGQILMPTAAHLFDAADSEAITWAEEILGKQGVEVQA